VTGSTSLFVNNRKKKRFYGFFAGISIFHFMVKKLKCFFAEKLDAAIKQTSITKQ